MNGINCMAGSYRGVVAITGGRMLVTEFRDTAHEATREAVRMGIQRYGDEAFVAMQLNRSAVVFTQFVTGQIADENQFSLFGK